MVQEPRVRRRRDERRNVVAIVDLDPRINDEERMELREETTSIQLGEDKK